jgi:Txe/YoeB family toxin of toxin-antitoxin system
MYKLRRTRQAEKDYEIAKRNGFAKKLSEFIKVVERDPYEDTPGHHYEELKDNYKGIHTRRFNRANRFAYEVLENAEKLKDGNGVEYEGVVRIFSVWGHFPPL